MSAAPPAEGQRATVLGIHVGRLEQLFHSMDPAPERRRDLDPNAVEYILEWARAASSRLRLKRLFSTGRLNLLIALLFFGAMLTLGEVLGGMASKERRGEFIEQSFVIIGWVALWRPAETFLYDWWPIRADTRLYERLSNMQVELVEGSTKN
jgi:hypothetical protein